MKKSNWTLICVPFFIFGGQICRCPLSPPITAIVIVFVITVSRFYPWELAPTDFGVTFHNLDDGNTRARNQYQYQYLISFCIAVMQTNYDTDYDYSITHAIWSLFKNLF